MVAKPEVGTWRSCGAFRNLNAKTISDKYPIHQLHDFAVGLQSETVFTNLDLVKAFYQIPVAEEDVKKIAMIIPFGLYEFDVDAVWSAQRCSDFLAIN